jgi:hypothetical protein
LRRAKIIEKYHILEIFALKTIIFECSITGLTPYVARVVGRMSEGMRIHISNTTKNLLDKIGGFRCEYRGVLELGVSLNTHIIFELPSLPFLIL